MITLVDTGPIVAYLREKDQYHAWAVEQFKAYSRPLLTCEAVLTEAAYLMQAVGLSPDLVLDLVTTGAVAVGFDMEAEAEALKDLLTRYHDVPMDLADACMVRMAELYPESKLLTVDSDFHIYRKHRHETIAAVMP